MAIPAYPYQKEGTLLLLIALISPNPNPNPNEGN